MVALVSSDTPLPDGRSILAE